LSGIRTLLESRPELRAALQNLIIRDLAAKVEGLAMRDEERNEPRQ
jgi:hypothetical protein